MIPTRTDRPTRVTRVGRLESLNGHGTLSGRLWLADGASLTCVFMEKHRDLLADAWMRRVRVSGRLTTRKGRGSSLRVDSVNILESRQRKPLPGEGSSFWDHKSLEQLVKEQGAKPIEDLDEIADLWPGDDDPDEFLKWLLESRPKQRELQKAKAR